MCSLNECSNADARKGADDWIEGPCGENPSDLRAEAKRLRELLVNQTNCQARDAFNGYRQAELDREHFARQKRCVVSLVEELDINPTEAGTELSIIYHDATDPKDDEDSRLIETAAKFVAQGYAEGKHDGREAVGFFRTILSRIDEKLLIRFDELV